MLILLGDMSTQSCAATQSWAHPITPEAMLLADNFDRQGHIAAGKQAAKVKQHPWIPWSGKARKKRVADASKYTAKQTLNILDRLKRGLIH